MKKYKKLEGVLHDIDLSIVSQSYLNRIAADKGETLDGCFSYDDHRIYIAKGRPEVEQVHSLLHELYHAFEKHTERMDREAKADAFAGWLMRTFKVKSIDDLIKK